MAEIEYTRQTGIINVKAYRNNTITIIGCGAIGSFVAISLAKMGLTNFILFDNDTVLPHNLPNQFFTVDDIDSKKIIATSKHMMLLNPECIIDCYEKFTNTTKITTPIVISCVDNIETRRVIFNTIQKNKKVQLFIDGRMNGLQAQVYAIDMTDVKQVTFYKQSLFSGKQAVQGRCTEKSIIFTVLGISSFICNQIVKALLGKPINNYTILDYQGNTVY